MLDQISSLKILIFVAGITPQRPARASKGGRKLESFIRENDWRSGISLSAARATADTSGSKVAKINDWQGIGLVSGLVSLAEVIPAVGYREGAVRVGLYFNPVSVLVGVHIGDHVFGSIGQGSSGDREMSLPDVF